MTVRLSMNHQIYLREVPSWPETSSPATSLDRAYHSDRYDDEDDVIAKHEDGAIEEDVLDLSIQVQQLQQQVGVLAESQLSTDDLYIRAKQDNAGLNNRILMLEEQTRELEGKGEEKVEDEQKRNNDLIARIERMKNLEIENYAIRLQNMEKENKVLFMEVSSLKQQLEKVRVEKDEIEENLTETKTILLMEQEQHMMLKEKKNREEEYWRLEKMEQSRLVTEKTEEVKKLRQTFAEDLSKSDNGKVVSEEISAHVRETEAEIRMLRTENKKLTEKNEELQAQLLNRQVKEGKSLLAVQQGNLAAEMGNMTEEQLLTSLNDQKDINSHLQRYIDSVLLNIMERYPELLEVANK